MRVTRVLLVFALALLALVLCTALPASALRSARSPAPADPVAEALERSTARPFAETTNLVKSHKKHHAHKSSSHKNSGSSKTQHHGGAAAAKKQAPTVRPPVVTVHQTTGINDDRLARLPPLKVEARTAATGNTPVLSIDPTTVYQTLVGFGGAITEASTTILQQMPPAATQTVLDAYYGEQGNRYSVARVHIGSCDFSVSSWNFNNMTDDFDMKYFDRSLSKERSTDMLPFILEAVKASYHPLQIFASPWSPPAWMKGNGNMNGSSTPGLKPDPRYHQAWADYLALWFDLMKVEGVPFWGMTVQNEPEYAANWEACVYSPANQRDFVRDFLGPKMREHHPEVKMMIYDHNKDHMQEWADTIYSDAEAAQYVWGTAIHWYTGDQFDNVAAVHDKWPAKAMLATEATNMASDTGGPAPGSILNGEKYAHDIIGDLNAWVTGWTDWNIVLDTQGGPNHLNNWCDAPVIANVSAGTLDFQPMYFYMGHFSRFLPPGAQRIAHSMSNWEATSGLDYATFLVQREDKAAADYRLSAESRAPQIKGHKAAAAAPKPYSAEHPSAAGADIVVVVLNMHDNSTQFQLDVGHGHTAWINMPPHSIQTIVFDAEGVIIDQDKSSKLE